MLSSTQHNQGHVLQHFYNYFYVKQQWNYSWSQKAFFLYTACDITKITTPQLHFYHISRGNCSVSAWFTHFNVVLIERLLFLCVIDIRIDNTSMISVGWEHYFYTTTSPVDHHDHKPTVSASSWASACPPPPLWCLTLLQPARLNTADLLHRLYVHTTGLISDQTFEKVHAHNHVHAPNSASKHINSGLFDQQNCSCVQMCVCSRGTVYTWAQQFCAFQ